MSASTGAPAKLVLDSPRRGDVGFKSRVVVKDAYTLLMERLSDRPVEQLSDSTVAVEVEPRKAAKAAARTRKPKAAPKEREPRRYAAWDDETRVRSVLDRADVHQLTETACIADRRSQKLQGDCGAEYHIEAYMGGI